MKVLIWNIQNLTDRRIFDESGDTDDERADNRTRAEANLGYIVNTVRDADPDVFVVIEPRCSTGVLGTLAEGGGPEALVRILLHLQDLSPEWWLVPPLIVNPQAYEDGLPKPTRSETVGVFWRGDVLEFTGPWVWPADAAETGPPVEHGPGATYPEEDGVLVPMGTQAAPAYRWNDTDFAEPFEFPYPHDRRPLLTTFRERAGDRRTIQLFSFHPSPSRAPEALSKLAALLDQHYVPGANTVTVAAGDMNVDLIRRTPIEGAALQRFDGYTVVAPAPLAPTMLRRSAGLVEAELATAAQYTKPNCLDYGFVRYGPDTARPAGAPAAKVVDRVAGSAAAPPFPAFTTDMAAPLATYLPPAGAPEDPVLTNFRNAMFRWRGNFGHISPPAEGTSDHLPVLLVI